MATKFGEDFEFPDEKEARQAKTTVEDDKLEIEIEDDTPVQDRGRKPMREPVEEPTEDELATYDEKVQARIKKFTRGYHDERRAKEEAQRERGAAENYARQIIEENKRLQQQLSTGSKVYIETSKGAAAAELVAAKEKYKKAYDAADPDELADAQADIARATLKMERTSDMKPIEVEEREFKSPAEPAASKGSIRTQRWVENNSTWWGKDEEMTSAALGLDKKLQREYGIDYIGSDEYFKVIDRTMRKRFPEHFEDAQSNEDDEPPPKKRTSEPVDEDDDPPRRATKPAAVVAPASRSTPPSRIKLKASEVAIARRLQVPLEQYAKQVALLKRGE